ncbi:MAG: hypothetical protein H6R13_2226 [Proteobacteria bacterium]|nr:hypothetical protein [Pseudomonadota bacterium]
MWPSLFKIVGGSLVAVAVLWALVLGWWQSNDYEPTRLELAMYLGALPLAIVGGYFLLKGFIEHLKTPVEAEKPKDQALADLDPLALAAAKTSAAEREFSIRLVSAHVVTATGMDTESLLAAIKDGTRPAPSQLFTDADGFPVFLARVEDLDDSAILEEFDGDKRITEQLEAREYLKRAMALLSKVTDQATETLSRNLNEAKARLMLNIVLLIPSTWSSLDLPALKAWLKKRYWSDLQDDRLSIEIVTVSHESVALRRLDEIILDANRDADSHAMTLVLGAMSSIDANAIDALDASGRLFSAKRQEQCIPGEGAVALLLANSVILAADAQEQASILGRVALAARDKPLDGGGRIRGKTIEQLISGLLDVTGIECATIKSVVADADHRAACLTEILDGLGQPFEHLDPIEDCVTVGSACGAMSPFGGLVALACGHAKALAEDAHVLVISNQHPTERGVLLVSPPSAQKPKNDSAHT